MKACLRWGSFKIKVFRFLGLADSKSDTIVFQGGGRYRVEYLSGLSFESLEAVLEAEGLEGCQIRDLYLFLRSIED